MKDIVEQLSPSNKTLYNTMQLTEDIFASI